MGVRLAGEQFGTDEVVSVRDFLIRPGANDNTTEIQAALEQTAGHRLEFEQGLYNVTSTLHTTSAGRHRLTGEYGSRANQGGTEIMYHGTGPLLENGSDNGHAWDLGEYDGPQGLMLTDIWLSHGSKDTALESQVGTYKAGAYGIRDWRGGAVLLHRIGIEGFEWNFWGVQSDLNRFDIMSSLYSRWGLYAGPRCDQFAMSRVYSFYCDRVVTIDRARQVRIEDFDIDRCGAVGICPIEIRKGSARIEIVRAWLEYGDAAQPSNMPGWVSAGIVDGYGPGGVGTTTTPASGITVEDPLFYTTGIGVPPHARSIISLGAAVDVRLIRPNPPVGSSTSDLDAMILAPVGTAYSATEASASVWGVGSVVAQAKLFLNEGSGAPSISTFADTSGNGMAVGSTGRFTIRRIGAVAGASELRIGTEGQAGQLWIETPGYTGGQTTRLFLWHSFKHGSAAPTTGKWERGDFVMNDTPSPSGVFGWICTTAGDFAATPPVFKTVGTISA